jgi:pimeloyl-ACP methyl ester carboxylesterase
MREIAANGWRFSCRESGQGGEPVLVLHGFPETSRMWVGLMRTLADAGYHCIAPDQRGYSPGACPVAVDEYRYEDLAGDILAIARAAGFERYHVVAHDWGAVAAWAALSVDPGPVLSYVAMSTPHYGAFAHAVWEDPEEQNYRDVLTLLTAEDHAAEAALSADDFATLRAVWSPHPKDEVDDYLTVFRQPGTLTGAINWYRACRAHRRALDDPSFAFAPVETPTTLVWGRDDPYVRPMSLDLAADRMKGEYRVIELDAGHWLVQEQPDAIATAVVEHLAAHAASQA